MSKQLSLSATLSAFTMTLLALAVSVGDLNSEAGIARISESAFSVSAITK